MGVPTKYSTEKKVPGKYAKTPIARAAAETQNADADIRDARINSSFNQGEIDLIKDIEAQPFLERATTYGGKKYSDIKRGTTQLLAQGLGGMLAHGQPIKGHSGYPETKDNEYTSGKVGLLDIIKGGDYKDKDNAVIARRDAPLAEGTGMAAQLIGTMPMYMSTGGLVRPAGKAAIAGTKQLLNAPHNLKKTGVLGKDIKQIADASNRGKHVIQPDAATQKAVQDLSGSAIVGVGEGILDPESSVIESVIGSTVGAIPGNVGSPRIPFTDTKLPNPINLEHTPYKLVPREQKLVDWAESKGMKPSVGTRTGSKPAIRQEAAMRNDPVYAGEVDRIIDEPNAAVEADIIRESMGMETKPGNRYLEPEELQAHKESLQLEMDELQGDTIGELTQAQLKQISKDNERLLSDTPGLENKLTIKRILEKVEALNPQRAPTLTGMKGKSVIDGKAYQELRSDIQEAATNMYDRKNTKAGKILTDLTKMLDDSVDRAIGTKHGPETSAKWRDVNERWAMMKLLVDSKGINPSGRIMPGNLTAYLKENDLERMVFGKGGRVSELHNLVKYHDLLRQQPQPGLSGTGITDTGAGKGALEADYTGIKPSDLMPNKLRSARIHRRFGRYPGKSGYLGGIPLKMGVGDIINDIGKGKTPGWDGANIPNKPGATDIGRLGLSPDNAMLNVSRIARATSQGSAGAPRWIAKTDRMIDKLLAEWYGEEEK